MLEPDLKVTLLGETLLLDVLSRAIRNDPDREWFRTLISQDLFSESPLDGSFPELEEGLKTLHTWSENNREGISDAHFLELQADYSRLFIGPGRPIAPPWESVFFNEDRMIFQEQTVQVRNWYRRFGLEVEKLYREPDDHIGLELSFLAWLAKQALESLEKNDQTGFQEILQAQKDFLHQHPLQWTHAWSSLVVKNAKTDFYRGLGKSIYGCVMALAAIFRLTVPQEPAS